MESIYNGSCGCGAIKIQLKGDPSIRALCHCTDCHRSSGSTYSTNFVWPDSSFTLVSGTPKVWEKIGDSGNPAFKNFCGDCGSPIWTRSPMREGIVVIKAGVLGEEVLKKFPPVAEVYTARRPGWVGSVEGATQFEGTFKTPS